MNSVCHVAFATRNLEEAKDFYGGFLRLQEGRSGKTWVDYDFFGHQLTIQYVMSKREATPNFFHPKTMFPANHFGAILESNDWEILRDKIAAEKVRFVIEPQVVFEGEVGEQRTMMLRDPDGNIIEFKCFPSKDKIFAKQ